MRTRIARTVAVLLLTFGLASAGSSSSFAEPVAPAGSALPGAVDDIPVSAAASIETTLRRFTDVRRRFRLAGAWATRLDLGRRFARWLLPVQFNPLPPASRGPTVLRL